MITNERCLKVWKIDDYHFVASISWQEARSWYDREYGKSDHVRIIDECSLDDTTIACNMPIPFSALIEEFLDAGATFPTVIATDKYMI
jgi:hypothetical protein